MSMWIDKNIHKLNDKKFLIFQKVEIAAAAAKTLKSWKISQEKKRHCTIYSILFEQ